MDVEDYSGINTHIDEEITPLDITKDSKIKLIAYQKLNAINNFNDILIYTLNCKKDKYVSFV